MTTETTTPAEVRVYSTESLRTGRERSAVLEQQITGDPSQFRVLTRARPTGALRLGHLIATVECTRSSEVASMVVGVVMAAP